MGVDPLYRPLGVEAPSRPVPPVARRGLIGALAVLVTLGGGWLLLRGSRHPHAPEAVATIEVAPAPAPAEPAPTPSTAGPARVVEAAQSSAPASTVEIQNGVKVVRFNPSATGPVTLGVEDASRVPLKPAPDPRVSEAFHGGVLPRLGPSGLRPAEVYAAPAPPASGPRVALLLDGMGADQMATADASRRLAGAVSFAFSSAAPDAGAQVAEARRAGHEVFMGVAGDGSLDALRGEMARFPGYVGLLPGEGALAAPELAKDVAARGVLVVPGGADADPGATRAVDLRVDAAAGPAAVSAALDRLLALAKDKGTAAALLSHGALASGQVADFASRLAAAGVTLVPASALLSPAGAGGKPSATVRAQ